MKDHKLTNFLCLTLIFIISVVVRFFIWQDTRFDVWKVQTGIAEQYRLAARFLVEDGFFSFFDSLSRLANPDFLGHPPGYSMLLAAVFNFFGESDVLVQAVSIGFDALSAVLIFLIARRLFSDSVGLVSGLLAAFSPSFALNSVFFLPDTLAVFPILLAVYFLVAAYQNPTVWLVILSGVSIGLSCWLRSNSMLLPIFFAFAIFLLFEGRKKYLYSAVLIVASIITVAPITIRNYVVHRDFVPISLGGGQILLEGIGDYDKEQKFGIPNTDFGICRMEADKYNRPDYAETLFGADGIKRDRMRLAQGAEFIKENPFWFSSVVVRRAVFLFNLEKAQIVSTQIPITHSISNVESVKTVWEKNASEIAQMGTLLSLTASLINSPETDSLILQTDATRFDAQFSLETEKITEHRDYLLNLLLYIKRGRTSVKIIGLSSGKTYNSTIVEFDEFDEIKGLTFEKVEIPFVLDQSENLRILISNETGKPPDSVLEIKQIKIYDLGEASFTWTKPIRFVVRMIQKLFSTAVIIPLALIGLIFIIRQKMWKPLLIISIVPIYYVCLQSFLHTEYRYVLALHYFVFILTAFFLISFYSILLSKIKNRRKTNRQN